MTRPKQTPDHTYARNLPRFFAYRILYNSMLFLPVWVIFLLRVHSLTLTQVTFVDFAFWMTMVLSEVPTGAVADTLGRKLSQLIGVGLTAFSILLFGLAKSYALLLLSNSLWAVAMTFISGADMAFLYDTLRAMGREGEYQAYRGRLQAVVLISIAVSSGLGGLLGAYDLQAPFTVTAALLVVAFILLLTCKEPPREPDRETGRHLSYVQTLRVAWEAIRAQAGLRYTLLYSSLLPLVGSAIETTFIQPYAVAIGLPIATLGLVSVAFRLFQVTGSALSTRLVKLVGEWNWLLAAPILEIGGNLALGALGGIGGMFFFACGGLASFAALPLVESLILRQSPGSVRATILSVDSMLFRLLLAGISPVLGIIGDRAGLSYAFVVAAGGIGLGLLVNQLFWRRVGIPAPAGQEAIAETQ